MRAAFFGPLLAALLGSLCLLAAQPALAQQLASESSQAKPRPKVGLVLSGGGARGMAHIGVLKVLHELQVPVDLVVGTSMGAVVGGAYAAGRSAEDLERLVEAMDWASILADRPQRGDLSFRRREDDQLLASRLEFGLSLRGVQLPPAAAGNASLELALASLAPGHRSQTPIKQLATPFKSLATDLGTGQLLVLDGEVSLLHGMRASMAVPGLFSPIMVKGRLLADGGLVRNLGVDVARAMGAEVVIAVNVGAPLLDVQKVVSAVNVTDQMVRILTTQNVERSLAELGPQDILISPELGELGLVDFEQARQVIAAGRQAASLQTDRLSALAHKVGAQVAGHGQAQIQLQMPEADPLPLASLSIRGSQHTHARALQAELGLKIGEPIDHERVAAAVTQLYGRHDFERVDSQVRDEGGQRHVVLEVTEASWTQSRLRLGFEVETDFRDGSIYKLKGLHTLSWLNAWGAELRTQFSLGSSRDLRIGLMQPLGAGSVWYLEPFVGDSAQTLGNSENLQNFISLQMEMKLRRAGLTFGRRLGSFGDLGLTFTRANMATRAIGFVSEAWEDISNDWYKQVELRWRVDSLDAPAFPTRGTLLDIALAKDFPKTWREGPSITARGLRAFRFGDWAGHVYLEAAQSLSPSLKSSGSIAEMSKQSLGGFMRLSGSLSKREDGDYRFGRGVVARRIGRMPVGLGGDVLAGASLELGWERRVDNKGDPSGPWSQRVAGSGFVAVDTRFGPVYLGLGHTVRGQSALYFFIGPIW